jgi:hypothetical protein
MGRQWTAGIAKAKELIQTDYLITLQNGFGTQKNADFR